ncbi:hypothetical protein I7I51_02024 [Histoplasma capsulatum]|uniref:Uncharacterized protein n=1 Tax=Ajellomyces capsulatus TaxID=5037 RepID=A0A8A1MEA8_AJECA|nr:hypothetical protein I7I51_02024 [Histoplasma capsulatum]
MEVIGDEVCVLGLEPAKHQASAHIPMSTFSHRRSRYGVWSMERYYLLLLPCTPYVSFQDSPVPRPHIALRVGTPIQHTTRHQTPRTTSPQQLPWLAPSLRSLSMRTPNRPPYHQSAAC